MTNPATEIGSGKPAPIAGAGTATMPTLYRRPVPLDPGRHQSLSLREGGGFGFARTAGAMVITAGEFAAAARQYPIVFAGEGPTMPVAVLGVRTDRNLFVDDQGEWARGAYIPAYARRYPFIFMETPDKSQLVLCIDEGSDLVVESDVRPLFRNGQRTELIDRALEFCTSYQRDFEATRLFTEALTAHELLVPNRADLRTPSGETFSVTGFRIIDEAKFNRLPDAVFLDWRRRGWVGLVYCHLLSTGGWSTLLDRLAGERLHAQPA